MTTTTSLRFPRSSRTRFRPFRPNTEEAKLGPWDPLWGFSMNDLFAVAETPLLFAMPGQPAASPPPVKASHWTGKAHPKILGHLKKHLGCGPFNGGCKATAHALQKRYGGQVMALTRKNGVADHAAVHHGGDRWLDCDGSAKRFQRSDSTRTRGPRWWPDCSTKNDQPEGKRHQGVEMLLEPCSPRACPQHIHDQAFFFHHHCHSGRSGRADTECVPARGLQTLAEKETSLGEPKARSQTRN